jgi:hypothetical protein
VGPDQSNHASDKEEDPEGNAATEPENKGIEKHGNYKSDDGASKHENMNYDHNQS